MADVKIVDIDSAQWNMKDQEARNRIAALETLHKNYGNIGIDDAIVYCEKNGNTVFIQGEKYFQMELHKSYKIALIPNDLPSSNNRAASPIIDYEIGVVVGEAYRPENSNEIFIYFTNGDTNRIGRYVFQLISFQENA